MAIARTFILPALVATGLFAASARADAPPPDETPPEVSIKSPTDGTALAAGTTKITVEVTAADPESGIHEVELKVDGKSVGTDDEEPFTFDDVALAPGEHTLVATARNYDAGSTESEPAKVTVPEAPPAEAKAEEAKAQEPKAQEPKAQAPKADAKADKPAGDKEEKKEDKKGCQVSATRPAWPTAGLALCIALLSGLMLRRRR